MSTPTNTLVLEDWRYRVILSNLAHSVEQERKARASNDRYGEMWWSGHLNGLRSALFFASGISHAEIDEAVETMIGVRATFG